MRRSLEGQMPEICGIVTNINNGGAVLGEPVADWQGIDLTASRGTMSINGEVVGEGVGSDVMGHPLEPLVWLANHARSGRQCHLEAGALVLTGSFAPPTMMNPGDEAINTYRRTRRGGTHCAIIALTFRTLRAL